MQDNTEKTLGVQGPPLVQGITTGVYLTPQPSVTGSFFLSYHVFKFICIKVSDTWFFFEVWIFWHPGNLNLALHRASKKCSLFCSLMKMAMMTWPV